MPAPRLILFFTYRVSLALWVERGILERETALYHGLVPHVGGVAFVTYGDQDHAVAARVAPLRVLPRPRRVSPAVMSVLAPWLYRREIRAASVIKTNQAAGAWTGVLAKWVCRRPLVVRCGYPWSANYQEESSKAWRRFLVRMLERLAVRVADRVVVTTTAVGEDLVRRHGVDRDRLRLVPNGVDVRQFAPDASAQKTHRLVAFVGRLSPEKNLAALIDAVARVAGARLLVIGDGPERERLQTRARALGPRVEFAGTIANHALPARLAAAEVFALPSHYEGHPKALLEAMACGVPVLGSDVRGIRDVVRHDETGWLCAPEPDALASGLAHLLDDAALRARLANAARAAVTARYSLEATVAAELAVLRELTT